MSESATLSRIVRFVGDGASARVLPMPMRATAEDNAVHTKGTIRPWPAAVFFANPPGAPPEKQPAVGPIDVVTEREQAFAVRREWMKLVGASEEEIEEACSDLDEPVSLDEETANLQAARRLQKSTPSAAEMLGWKNRY